jgi:sporulation protein YlmC with PRC-barrel domain
VNGFRRSLDDRAPENRENCPAEENIVSEEVEFTIGADVVCSDGPCGELRRVVVNPVARAITHLAVEPKHRKNKGHLVPIDRVENATSKEIRLRCSMSELEAFEPAEETELLPGASGQWGYGQHEMYSFPYYGMGGLGMGGFGMGGLSRGGLGVGIGTGGVGMGGIGMGAGPHLETFDRVPDGDVDVRRGQPVHATDGHIGRVKGLVIDPADYHVTHVLLDEGHLWGKKEVAIPISAVSDVADGVRLNITKDAVRDLPPVDLGNED